MIIDRGEHRSLVSWLMSQEKVIGLWIDEVLSVSTVEHDLVRKLEQHRNWLAARINELAYCSPFPDAKSHHSFGRDRANPL